MKILLLTTHFNPGGITSYVLSLAKGLKNSGDFVIVSSSGGDCVNTLKEQGIRHIDIPIKTKSELSPKIWLSFFKLMMIIIKNKIEIIHAQTRVTQVLGYLLAKFVGIHLVSTCHGFFKPRCSRKIFGCWGKRVIAISKKVEFHLINDFKIEGQRINLIYHGIDIFHYNRQDNLALKYQKKKELGLDDNTVIGIIARLSPVKGHIFLIKAFKELLKENYKVKLLIVGDGPQKANLLNLVEELELKNYVLFHSSVGDTKEILGAVDIFCLPSLKEGLGLSILEAMASGIPVAASSVGGIGEIIEDEKTGILFPPSNSNAIKEAIVGLINNLELRKEIIDNALKAIKERFLLNEMVSKTREVYSAALH